MSEPTPATVTCRGLVKRFGGSGGVLAVDGLDLDVPAGSVFGLLGPNGAGKTTTLRLVTGLARPTAGVGHHRRSAGLGRRRRLDARRGIGVLDQDPRYYGWMTGRELVAFAGELQGLAARDARTRADETLELVGLADARARRIAGYSGGMRQRLGIAQALVARPRLLVLDEPVSSLDPEGRRDLLALIADVRASATVIFSTHVLADVERICDRVAILDHGRLVTEGTLEALLARYASPLYRLDPEPGQEAALGALAVTLRAHRLDRWRDRARRPADGVGDRRGGGLGRAAAAGRRGRGPPGGVRARPALARGRLPAPGRPRTGHRARRAGRGMSGA